jgi:eukaryotic-like serine/threonine-protein kinase
MRLGDSMRRRRGLTEAGTRPAKRPRPEREGPHFPWRGWLIAGAVASVLAFLGGYLFATRVLFPPIQEFADDGIPVPDLAGQSVADARRALAALGLEIGDVVEIPHPRASAGSIIAQSPIARQHLRPGAEVRLALSAGARRIAVPDVVGLPPDRARSLLQRLGFQVDHRDEPADVPAGQVIRIEPGAGTELGLPARVLLVVSTGSPFLVEPDTTFPGGDTIPDFR